MFVPRRLDKYLKDCTPLSVKQVEQALSEGRVRIEGRAALDPTPLVFDEDTVTLDGVALRLRADHTHLMLNKPLSVTSTARDPEGRADLSGFLHAMPPGVFPIGRLDRDTSGLLLFTSDGDLAHAVLHPEHHTDKIYWLWLNEVVEDDDPRLAQMLEGFVVREQHVRARAIEVLHRTSDLTELLVTLNEGKNRQIRRMLRALGFHLQALHRRSVGPLSLGDLPLGQWRALSDAEVDALWTATGGRDLVRARKVAALRLAQGNARAAGAADLRLEAWLAGEQGSRRNYRKAEGREDLG